MTHSSETKETIRNDEASTHWEVGLLKGRRRVVPCLLILCVSAACTSDAPPPRQADSPPSESLTPSPETTELSGTLQLKVFADGQILQVTRGHNTVVADWPSRTAPYRPPIETKHGFIGLSRGRSQLDLWLVDGTSSRRLAKDVGQSFAVSAGATTVAYSLPNYSGGRYRTRLMSADLPNGRTLHTKELDSYAQPIGFIDERVLVGVGDAVAHVALWDPATGQLDPLSDYGRAGTTDPTSRQALLYQGDGPCWDIGNWANRFSRVRSQRCDLSAPMFAPDATWIGGIEGTEFGPDNRFRVYEAFDAERYFRSSPIPGAYQFAWTTLYEALVVGNEKGLHTVYRCRTDDVGKKDCIPKWTTTTRGRYSVWVIPNAPLSMAIRKDHGKGFAMWPEHRGIDAKEGCASAPDWRANAQETAEEFGREVLGWSGGRAVVDQYGLHGVHARLHRGDGRHVQVWLSPVAEDCWAVTGVARPSDRRPEGVSASVRRRRVQVGVLSLGAASAEVIIGFNGREVRASGADTGANVRLEFRPRGSGFFLVLLRDADGQVFGAAGALLYPGLVAG